MTKRLSEYNEFFGGEKSESDEESGSVRKTPFLKTGYAF